MARNYTPNQQKAINHGNHNILVSASAGSGKTSVLVERVIQKIISGVDVDNLLVVTFTEAAAREMKERIQTAITKKIAEVHNYELQQHLQQQIGKLSNAQISTIHAFCMLIIKTYYYVIDLDPAFRLMDTYESELLKERIWSDLREELYAADEDGKFAQLTRNFSSDRSDQGLQDLVLKTFEFANSNPNPMEWLDKMNQAYEIDENHFQENVTIQRIIAETKKEVMDVYKSILDIYEYSLTMGDEFAKYAAKYEIEVKSLRSIIEDDFSDWNRIVTKLIEVKFYPMPRGKKEYVTVFNEYAKETHKSCKEQIEKLINRYYLLNKKQMITVMHDSQTLVNELAIVVKKFSERFLSEKMRLKSFDFSDLEHFALQIVTNQTDQGKAVQSGLKDKYQEVIVDEYQDINPLQETILKAVAKVNPGNMFMVGDVKQSIYAFRMADPGLFINKAETFQQDDNEDERIVLSDNFRSMQNITDFTNFIFNQIMDKTIGEIEYDQDAQLLFGAHYYPAEIKNKTELLLYSINNDDLMDESLVMDKKTGQFEMIAQRIKKLINSQKVIYDTKSGETRPIQYSDIALLHETSSNNIQLVDIFKEYNIPIEVNEAKDYFQTTEISIMMSLLKIIDNPYQDIPLVAVLRSPMFGLKENELAFLRITNKTADYFQAVQYFANEFTIDLSNEFQMKLKNKIDNFLGLLAHFQTMAKQASIVELIWDIYDKTGYLDYVGGMPDGSQRQNNLHALYDRAKVYEQSSFKGVFQFVRFVELMQQKEKDLAENTLTMNENSVKVMTIHGSKGLEFPVVFLIETEHLFNNMDLKGNYTFNRDYGIGITLKDFVHQIQIDTPVKNNLLEIAKTKMLAEKMRLLYVALTRAQQKLIITGAVDDETKIIERWRQKAKNPQTLINDEGRKQVSNFLEWIGMAIFRLFNDYNPDYLGKPIDHCQINERNMIIPDLLLKVENEYDLNRNKTDDEDQTDNNNVLGQVLGDSQPVKNETWIKNVLDFKYGDEVATKTTAYQAVSEVKRLFDDPDKFEMNYSEVQIDQKMKPQYRYVTDELPKPRFMQQSKVVKSTDIGTATHLVLQKIDLTEEIDIESIKDTIQNLVLQHLIEENVAAKIDPKHILAFFNSAIGQLMINNASAVHREEAFSLLLPANKIFSGLVHQDDILIHGIIDAYMEIGNRIILLDYKTDKVFPGSTKAGVNALITRYQGQINLYAKALENMLGKKVSEKYLYSLSIGKLVEIS